MILVTGATGNIGQHLVPALQAAGLPFRALQHDKAIPGVESVKGDASKPDTLSAAFEGVDTLFMLSPYTLDLAANERNLTDAAKAAGVGHIVKLSAVGADANARSTVFTGHAESEAYLRASGVPFTIIHANSFMQNIPAFFGQAVKDGQGISVDAGEGKVAWIDLADLADAVVALLQGPPRGAVVELSGPEALSYRDAANLLSAQTGHKVPYTALTEAQGRDGMVQAGFPDWMAKGFAAFFAMQSEGGFGNLTSSVQTLTGRPPRRLKDFLATQTAAFA